MTYETKIESGGLSETQKPNADSDHLSDDGLVGVGPDAFVNVVRKGVPRGGICEVKKLFEGPQKCECCINWVETPPLGSNNEFTTTKWGEFAVVARKTSHGGDWKLQSITVYSQPILFVLRKFLKNYPGVSISADEVQFVAPFASLLHFWSEIVTAIELEVNESTRKHLDLFREILDPELAPGIKAADECRKNGEIEFNHLWTIFKPRTLVYWEEEGQANLGRLNTSMITAMSSVSGGSTLTLNMDQVDFDGIAFGFRGVTRVIESYPGTKSIFELPVPLDLKPDSDDIKELLTERGRQFVSSPHLRDFLLSLPSSVNVLRNHTYQNSTFQTSADIFLHLHSKTATLTMTGNVERLSLQGLRRTFIFQRHIRSQN